MHVKEIYKRYVAHKEVLSSLEIEHKNKKIISAILLGMFIVSAPIIIIINLFIFYSYYQILVIALLILVNFWYLLARKFYYETVQAEIGPIKVNFKFINLFEEMFILPFLIISCIIIFSIVGW